VPIHGRSRADDLARDAAGTGSRNDTHSDPACCRAPSADSGSSAGEGAGNNRTDESNSGLEQTHQGTNVGATGLEPATSWLGAKKSERRRSLQPNSFSTTRSRVVPTCSATSLRMPLSVPLPERIVIRHRHMMLAALVRREPNVRALLPRRHVAVGFEQFGQLRPRDVPRKPRAHGARISSRTMCRRITLGACPSSK
jgi:hypothetical protein